MNGDASSFLVANTNYARIDGPSVWIEVACQNGVVFRNQIHYHTLWRDHVRDSGKDLRLTTALDNASTASVSTTNPASYVSGWISTDSTATIFGTSLASSTASATTTPLPTTLGGIQIQVNDSVGSTRTAPLFDVSPTRISFQAPTGTAAGCATVTVARNGVTVGQGTATVESVTPGLFAANADGKGVAAAI